MPVPTPYIVAAARFNESAAMAGEAVKNFNDTFDAGRPKPVPRPRSERSAPVRNPAFREHEGLKDLQRQLNSRR